jgi:hypothetical protein
VNKEKIKDIEYVGKFTCSAQGMKKIADWLEEKVGHDGDCEVNVSVYEYSHLKTLGFHFDEDEGEKKL